MKRCAKIYLSHCNEKEKYWKKKEKKKMWYLYYFLSRLFMFFKSILFLFSLWFFAEFLYC